MTILSRFTPVLLLLLVSGLTAEEPIKIQSDQFGLFEFEPAETPADKEIWPLKTPTPNIVCIRGEIPLGETQPLIDPALIFNPDATEAKFELWERNESNNTIVVESAEASGQQTDGRILFTAADAVVKGTNAKLESHPGNSRIGFWTGRDDRAIWEYTATRPGTYRATLCYSRSGGHPATVALSVGDSQLTAEIKGTGSWYRYQSEVLGTVTISKPGKLSVEIKGIKTVGALINLKGLVLTPISEGKPVQTADVDGVILCHSRDATIHGVQVQYEPKPEKNTVGYWTHVSDRVSWTVDFPKAGKYDVEVLQGCGKGHGGSEVNIVMLDQSLSFVVEDTGHFQNFKSRVIGQFKIDSPGRYRFMIVPTKKASVAVMDVRQVRLLPISK
jgi:hypothetical protein